MLRKKDKAKFGIINKNITVELVNFINERDKVCKYCKGEFEPRAEWEHVNAFKPLSIDNIAKACSKCNQSKNNADLIQWMNYKSYKIDNEIIDLYKKAY
jgi:hypothetical protein